MVDIAEIGFGADTKELSKANKELKNLKPSAEGAEKSTDKLNKQLDKTNTKLGKVARSGGVVTKVFKSLSKGTGKLLNNLKGIAVGALAVFAFSSMITGAREFSGAVAELNTLLPTSVEQLDGMTQAARAMADEFGTNAAFQIKAFYGAVSAGATDAAAAINVVDAANRLAIGGITDVTTGVDILTTATNAYASVGLEAGAASDALFVGMKAGKTTIGELASGLGNVVPIAASLGVGFDELVAGTAALTLQGLSTASAITSLRAILSGVAKPTSEASKMAKKLGIDFSTTALEAKGLSGFLQDINEKTGGSADKLSVLFGSVEALNAALAFAGSGGDAFNDILTQMEDKLGATNEAFEIVTRSLDFRFGAATNKIKNIAIDFGKALLVVLVPALEMVASVAGFLVRNIDALVISAGIAAAIYGGPLVLAFVATQVAAFSLVGTLVALRTALITTGIGALIVGAGFLVAAFIRLIKGAGGFGAAMNLMKIVVIDVWDRIGEGGTSLAEGLGFTFNTIKAGWFGLLADMQEKWADFLHMTAGGMRDIPGMETAWLNVGNAAIMAGSTFRELTLAQSDATDAARDNAIASVNAANAMLEPITSVSMLTDAMKRLSVEGVSLDNTFGDVQIEDIVPKLELVGDAVDTVADKMKNLAVSSINRLGDAFIDLAVDGKASFADLAKSVIKDLYRIALQALIVKPLLSFLGLSDGGAVGGGGLLPFANGAAFDSGNVVPFAKGGDFTNSVVNKATPFAFAKGGALGVMGEAGPEAVMPLERGPDGSLGVQMYGGNGQKQVSNNVEIFNEYRIEGAVSEDKIIATIQAQGEQTKEQVKRSVVGWLNEYDQNGTM